MFDLIIVTYHFSSDLKYVVKVLDGTYMIIRESATRRDIVSASASLKEAVDTAPIGDITRSELRRAITCTNPFALMLIDSKPAERTNGG